MLRFEDKPHLCRIHSLLALQNRLHYFDKSINKIYLKNKHVSFIFFLSIKYGLQNTSLSEIVKSIQKNRQKERKQRKGKERKGKRRKENKGRKSEPATCYDSKK